ncbi:hypothetical protein GW7_08357, partial [Heterocephalus glaber]
LASVRKTSFPGPGAFGLQDVWSDEPQMEDIGDLTFHGHPTWVAPAASRFLKGDQSMGVKPARQGRGPWLSSGRSPSTALATSTASAAGSRIRASEVLRKAARIESKILSRAKVHVTQRDTESDPKTMGERPPKRREDMAHRGPASPLSQEVPGTFWTGSQEAAMAESPAPGGDSRRFLKTKGPAMGDRGPDTCGCPEETPRTPRRKGHARKLSSPDSEEDMRALLRSLVESPREETSGRLGLPGGKVSQQEPRKTSPIPTQRRVLPGAKPAQMLSPPASGSAHRAPHSTHSRTRSPQTPVSGDPTSCTAWLSISGTSVKSVSSAAVHGRLASCPGRSAAGPGDGDDDSLKDFRVNILSLEDLAPALCEKSDWAQRVTCAQGEKPSGSSLAAQAAASAQLEASGRPQPQSSAFQGAATPGAGDKGVPTESRASECLGGSVSSRRPWSEAPLCSLASTAHSQDLECSPGPSQGAPAGTLDTLSSSAGMALLPRPPSCRCARARPATRVTLRETAVQTLDVASTGLWAEALPVLTTVAGGGALGGTYVDPVPIAPHVLSADAIEALTAHSPAAVALEDLLRQQLHLTQQFIQASRHLHVSLLQSLDGDTFHYHSLEEAKEYVRCHRPGPLTVEDTPQEVMEE